MEKELREQREIIEKIYISTEKTRKYFLTILWVSAIGFLIPLIGLLFAVPSFLSSYSGMLDLPQ